MKAQAPGQFPDSLDRVQLRAAGQQEVQYELGRLIFPPGLAQPEWISGVVADGHGATSAMGSGGSELLTNAHNASPFETPPSPDETRISHPGYGRPTLLLVSGATTSGSASPAAGNALRPTPRGRPCRRASWCGVSFMGLLPSGAGSGQNRSDPRSLQLPGARPPVSNTPKDSSFRNEWLGGRDSNPDTQIQSSLELLENQHN